MDGRSWLEPARGSVGSVGLRRRVASQVGSQLQNGARSAYRDRACGSWVHGRRLLGRLHIRTHPDWAGCDSVGSSLTGRTAHPVRPPSRRSRPRPVRAAQSPARQGKGLPANEFSDTLAGMVNKLLKAVDIQLALDNVQRSDLGQLYPLSRRSG